MAWLISCLAESGNKTPPADLASAFKPDAVLGPRFLFLASSEPRDSKKRVPELWTSQRVIPGHPPKVLDPLMVSGTPSYSHTLPISSGILDWEWEIRDYYGKLKGVPSFRGGPWNSHWTSEWCILELLGETEWLSQCALVGLQRLMLPCVGKKDAE